MNKKVSISWSGGKDSAFALYKVLLGGEYDVVSLHTVFNAETKRVGMHGVHETLIEKQADLLKIPLEKLFLDPSEDHDSYTSLVKNYYNRCSARGIEAVVFGDIFLDDLKKFRDGLLVAAGLEGIYPLWQIDSNVLMHDFVNLGFKTLICAANANYFSETTMGKTIDLNFIKSLPVEVDPCGENGEFHTLVYDGPIFHSPMNILIGEIIEKHYTFKILDNDGNVKKEKTPFWFCELSL
jgi:uncharacterized protein (TIGR00290 family)